MIPFHWRTGNATSQTHLPSKTQHTLHHTLHGLTPYLEFIMDQLLGILALCNKLY